MKDAQRAWLGKAGANQKLRHLLALGSVQSGLEKTLRDPSEQRAREGVGFHVEVERISISDAHLDADFGDPLVERAMTAIDGDVDCERDRSGEKEDGHARVD